MSILKMMNERILLELVDYDDRESTTLILPEGAHKTHLYFRVLAVGPGMVTHNGQRVEPTVKEGDMVIMVGGGTPIRIDRKDYRIATERDFIAVVPEK
tara:strand:- start:104367 stop:104660 length:294 start_codon:yes stop_codon:yes gene_type:complete